MTHSRSLWNVCLGIGLCLASGLSVGAAEPQRLSFNRDVRPLLSDNCFQCHGPDKNQRKADLRLDSATGGALGKDGQPGVIVPGKPDASELVRRLTAEDPDERMPPASSGRQLTPAQVATLQRWVAEGANFEGHWSLLPPQRAALPDVSRPDWPLHPLDRFVLARLDRETLAPSPPASRYTLARRLSLDLTGLPMAPDEVDTFVADDGPDAVERLVDRLLASPRHGERLATRWLDAARYADTSGYQSDGPRFMWRWRDWVIDAFNRGMPFDQFTVEQLAGDLLPDATLDQRIATGFNRNHRGNAEGGIIAEEYAVEYVVDRVDTTATVWLGLTLGCARCHDHKFDPVSQQEYYQLFAFFNNVPEYGRAIKEGNSPPFIKAPTRIEAVELTSRKAEAAAARARLDALAPEILAAQRHWETRLAQDEALRAAADRWDLQDGLAAYFTLDNLAIRHVAETTAASKQSITATVDGTTSAIPAPATELVAASQVSFVPGRIGQAAACDGKQSLSAAGIGDFSYFDPFSLSVWVQPTDARGGTILSRMSDVPRGDGYAVRVVEGRVQLNFVKRWHDDALRVESAEPLAVGRWQHLLVVYDGTRNARGVKLYVDGQLRPLRVHLDLLNQTFQVKEPLRLGGGGGADAGFHGLLDEARVYRRALDSLEAQVLSVAEPVSVLAAKPTDQRAPAESEKLRRCFLDQFAPPAQRDALTQVVAAERRRQAIEDQITTVMVMEDMPEPRVTRVLRRGEYDKPGEPVQPGVPAAFPPLGAADRPNRLGLARWLVDVRHPLTARVAVNRVWQAVFGQGLVRTTEDFGSQGLPPTHPELLDTLAVEFRDGGGDPRSDAARAVAWDVKQLWRALVTSATYRQSSRVTPQLLERDAENLLLARAPRFRLPAEMIRDQALAASGLLVDRVGGPSVKPYQPADLWKELATDTVYSQSTGADLYRRTMYTFFKRTVAPPTLITFDAAGREACVVRDSRTNTPLQALTLLNEVTFVEAARALGERVLREADSPEQRISLAFRLAVGRPARSEELSILHAGWETHLRRYQQNPEAARQLLAIGDSRPQVNASPAELAAYVATASVILNLDEALTKE